MTEMISAGPRSDLWPINELISAALSADNESARWEFVQLLQYKGGKVVFEVARLLCTSGDARKQQLGADMLGQLGRANNPQPEQSVEMLLSLLLNDDVAVLTSALAALWCLDLPPAAAELILRLKNHNNASVRTEAAAVIGQLQRLPAVCSNTRDALVDWTRDIDRDVRLEAVSALAFSEPGDKGVREALRRCAEDACREVRATALLGLAYENRDSEVIDLLMCELSQAKVLDTTLEAAALTADPRLLPFLLVIRNHGTESMWLDVAIDECSGKTRKGLEPSSDGRSANSAEEVHYRWLSPKARYG